MEDFKNLSLLDFSKTDNKKAMEKAIADVESQFGKEHSLIIDGKNVKSPNKFKSLNPSNTDEVVGVFQKATQQIADKAMKVALKRFETWRFTPAQERADYLLKVSEIMKKRRLELAAWMVLEVGKNWVEADADVAEAIDFCEFYAREALRYADDQPLTKLPNERNALEYIPLGVGLVIPPWNFPLAILVGMTTASWVAGNTVLLKPASDAPAIGTKFAEICHEAGLPDGVLNLVVGSGAEVGDYLVQHPKTRFIAFTGSMEVGLGINEKAARLAPGQIWIKRVLAEMGGKDCMVIDSEADLDKAVPTVLGSAYGYQGQKCSACSRLILHKDIYDEFLERFVPMVQNIKVGEMKYQENFMGPVINASAERTCLNYIEIGKLEGRMLAGGGKAEGNGYYIQPTVFADVDTKAIIAQEEIFGPVLTVIKAESYEHAIDLANDTIYGLTGSVYTQSKEKMAYAQQHFHVGNLYFNRKCTGALVGVHPFGGFNMSGTDSKAGGRDYLMIFTQAKCTSEVID